MPVGGSVLGGSRWHERWQATQREVHRVEIVLGANVLDGSVLRSSWQGSAAACSVRSVEQQAESWQRATASTPGWNAAPLSAGP
jgi:hypothetical protein